ncbi:MAG: phosphatidylserine decarboxylase [Candidatus Thermoplasmatota archaeon]|nr:phosphatidylserine decarboxylase [Candidatus Thermoplasmatota archaeon]MBU4072142.1 phosphatidylserine decarboxylase [Candidatus Thermoplasmatota archaeon]MBU4145051.1 phosphatidylserine decarboxylase [Candidatus Thermoplasmatota archaeon]MBU4591434.1 phosphatidylserine decarboxylase [Candidatus Thermoplasmatota archaeon]
MFARGSAGIIISPFIAALFMLYIGIWPLALVLFMFFGILLMFFRDPEREVGEGIVSAADGVVDWAKVEDNWLKISVFMNLHNVHVNRAPLSGSTLHVTRKAGGMWPAFLERSERNARAMMTFSTPIGEMKVVQISGVFAWRVCPYVRKGHNVRRGKRIGMIRFGSRVNVWLPADKVVCRVEKGQKTVAGVTTIAEVRK